MNTVQIHLALTHVPVVLSLVGLIMLITAYFIKNDTLTRTSYYVILFAGLSALPVFFSGEGAEETVENLPGVSEPIIERHENVAKLAMFSIAASGLIALAGLIFFKLRSAVQVLKAVVLLLTITSGGLMIQTAHLGGQIRHTEIRSGAVVQVGNENVSEGSNSNEQENEED